MGITVLLRVLCVATFARFSYAVVIDYRPLTGDGDITSMDQMTFLQDYDTTRENILDGLPDDIMSVTQPRMLRAGKKKPAKSNKATAKSPKVPTKKRKSAKVAKAKGKGAKKAKSPKVKKPKATTASSKKKAPKSSEPKKLLSAHPSYVRYKATIRDLKHFYQSEVHPDSKIPGDKTAYLYFKQPLSEAEIKKFLKINRLDVDKTYVAMDSKDLAKMDPADRHNSWVYDDESGKFFNIQHLSHDKDGASIDEILADGSMSTMMDENNENGEISGDEDNATADDKRKSTSESEIERKKKSTSEDSDIASTKTSESEESEIERRRRILSDDSDITSKSTSDSEESEIERKKKNRSDESEDASAEEEGTSSSTTKKSKSSSKTESVTTTKNINLETEGDSESSETGSSESQSAHEESKEVKGKKLGDKSKESYSYDLVDEEGNPADMSAHSEIVGDEIASDEEEGKPVLKGFRRLNDDGEVVSSISTSNNIDSEESVHAKRKLSPLWSRRRLQNEVIATKKDVKKLRYDVDNTCSKVDEVVRL
ncbi:hypothetical protein BaOVIS_010210 [Babesia ovis]|uniref:Uncharacterized protein n=1 Tax=Babesia ovis TaxID=5869 RepID=A0A9W5T987_BABOV|nr:hypothetical protein BaOVIS_010210 [Babesia ovis]